MDDLGMDDKIIENLNLIKIWQLEVAALTTGVKRFISLRVIRGIALVEMIGVSKYYWLNVNRRKKVLISYPLIKNLLSSRCHES